MSSLLQKAKRLISRGRTLPEHVVEHSRVHEAVLTDTRRRATKLDDAITSPPYAAGARSWERLAEDAFFSYFGQDEPRIRSRDEIDPTMRVNREILDRLTRSDKFREQHASTRMKQDLAALGTMGALESLAESYADELAEHVEQQAEMESIDERLDEIDAEMERAREERAEIQAEGEDGLEDAEGADDAIRELAQEKREQTSAKAALALAQAQSAVELGDAAGKAVAAAVGAAERTIEAAQKVPGIGKEAGAGSRVSPELAFALAERVASNPLLERVLDIMGALRLDMGTKRRKMRKGGYEEMVDIERGRDLQVVLPQEKMLMRHPLGRREFFRRWSEESLLQYEMWSEEELKRGPFIFGIDGSLSMKGAKNEYARGLALAAADIANREQRNAAVIEFSGVGQTDTWFFPKGSPLDPETILDLASSFMGGGTSILSFLRDAKALIDTEAPFHAADIVIATDGEDDWTPADEALIAELREQGVQVHGLALGISPTPYLLNACETTTSVYDFTVPTEGSDRLAIDMS